MRHKCLSNSVFAKTEIRGCFSFTRVSYMLFDEYIDKFSKTVLIFLFNQYDLLNNLYTDLLKCKLEKWVRYSCTILKAITDVINDCVTWIKFLGFKMK